MIFLWKYVLRICCSPGLPAFLFTRTFFSRSYLWIHAHLPEYPNVVCGRGCFEGFAVSRGRRGGFSVTNTPAASAWMLTVRTTG